MDPYQQYPNAPQGSQGNPYDFIHNPAKPRKKKAFGSSNNNLLKTAIIVVVVAVVVMIGLTVLLNALAPKRLGAQELTGIAQTQSELLRVASQAAGSAVQQTTKNLATTVQFTMTTQRHQTLNLLAAKGVKVGAKQLAL